jgi:hypothetical protein
VGAVGSRPAAVGDQPDGAEADRAADSARPDRDGQPGRAAGGLAIRSVRVPGATPAEAPARGTDDRPDPGDVAIVGAEESMQSPGRAADAVEQAGPGPVRHPPARFRLIPRKGLPDGRNPGIMTGAAGLRRKIGRETTRRFDSPNFELAAGRAMFCERCLPLARSLAYDPAAIPYAELLSGSCIWSDETRRGWCIRCKSATRILFGARYCMTIGEPVISDVLALWESTAGLAPNWPLFRPERRGVGVEAEVRRLVEAMNAQLLGDLEEGGNG